MPEEKKKSPEPVRSTKAEGTLLALALDSRSGSAFVGGSRSTVDRVALDADPWELKTALEGKSYVAAMTVLGDESLAVGRYDGSLAYFPIDAKTGVPKTKPPRTSTAAHRGWIRDLCTFDDGRRLASVGDDMFVRIWEPTKDKPVAEFKGHADETPQGYLSMLYCVAATPDGKHLASGDRVGRVILWDAEKQQESGRFDAPTFYTFDGEKRDRSIGGIRRLAFSPDGKLLALAGIGTVTNIDGFVGPCRIEIWDWQKRKRVMLLEDDHKAVLNDLLWTTDGKRIVAAGGGDAGGILAVWAVDDPKAKQKVKHNGHIQRLAWLEADRRLVAAGFESVQLWDLAKLT